MITTTLCRQLLTFGKYREPAKLGLLPMAVPFSDGELGYLGYSLQGTQVTLRIGEEPLQGYLRKERLHARLRENPGTGLEYYEEDTDVIVLGFAGTDALTAEELETCQDSVSRFDLMAFDGFPLLRELHPYYLPMEVTDERTLRRMEEAMDALLWFLEQYRQGRIERQWLEVFSSQDLFKGSMLLMTRQRDGSYALGEMPIPAPAARILHLPRPLTSGELFSVRNLPREGRWDFAFYTIEMQGRTSSSGWPLPDYAHGTVKEMVGCAAREDCACWIPQDELLVQDYVHCPEHLLQGLTVGFAKQRCLPQQIAVGTADALGFAVLQRWCEDLGIELVRADDLPGILSFQEYARRGGSQDGEDIWGLSWEEAMTRADLHGSYKISVLAGRGVYRHLWVNASATLLELGEAIREAFPLSGAFVEDSWLAPGLDTEVRSPSLRLAQEDGVLTTDQVQLGQLHLRRDFEFCYTCRTDARTWRLTCRALAWSEETQRENIRVARRSGRIR